MQMYDDGMIRPCEHKATKGPEDHGSRVKTEDHGTRGPGTTGYMRLRGTTATL